MKYSELNIGDYFKIVRENNNKIYVKQEFYFTDINDPKRSYRKLNGCTQVERVEL